MLAVHRLAKTFGNRTLFQDVTFELVAGRRYGLVGANGSGKTTLLNILAGSEPPSDGSINRAKNAGIGVLRQDRFQSNEQPVVEVAMMGHETAWSALTEQASLTQTGTVDASRIADLQDKLAATEAYSLEARASAVLTGLGVAFDALRQPLGRLSGGHQLRVLLGQVLVGSPDIMLLDEPTNHLDILSIRWLEKFLSTYSGAVVVISHDQRFLDNVATHILDVDYGTVTQYTGNYAEFTQQKEAAAARMEAEADRVRKRIDEQLAFVERFRAKATKARQAQSRLRQIERIELPAVVRTSRRVPVFRFTPRRSSGRDVLQVKELAKSYGTKPVLSDVSLLVRRSERLAIIGANGIGKSTLLRILAGRLEADAGTVRWGHAVSMAYFPQNHLELLQDSRLSALDYLWGFCPTATTGTVRSRLGLVLFSGDDVDKRLGVLSGGEAARLIFAQLTVQEPNVLLLDEPTNHLDVEAIRALVSALRTYEGTLLFVSHDRWFVSQLATRVIELRADGRRDYPGSYDEYVASCGDDHLDSDAVLRRAKEARSRTRTRPQADEVTLAQRRRKNLLKTLPQKRDAVLCAIEELESRKQAISAMYCQPDFFRDTPKERLEQLRLEQAELERELGSRMEEWERLEAEIAAVQSEGQGEHH
ncbi:MAG: ABC-F family ATP-binding cassette domain-containing protein [Polyangiaceae bacterium]|nr:ABC-F family ATP-binding cassette domain-containing protein [Polyangiaceae bacterium]